MALSDDPDEVNHVVCCRRSWTVTMCGLTEEQPINLTSAFLCAMCIETITRLRPTWPDEEPRICPLDHRPCPPEHEVDERIERTVGRPLD